MPPTDPTLVAVLSALRTQSATPQQQQDAATYLQYFIERLEQAQKVLRLAERLQETTAKLQMQPGNS